MAGDEQCLAHSGLVMELKSMSAAIQDIGLKVDGVRNLLSTITNNCSGNDERINGLEKSLTVLVKEDTELWTAVNELRAITAATNVTIAKILGAGVVAKYGMTLLVGLLGGLIGALPSLVKLIGGAN